MKRHPVGPFALCLLFLALHVTAAEPNALPELWRSDGTLGGTQVADLLPGPAGSLPGQLRVADGRLYFYAITVVKGRQLWCHDPEKAPLAFQRP